MINLISKGLRAALAAESTVTAITSRVYTTQAPLSATLPYVVIALAGGGSTNTSNRDEIDQLWTVNCISNDANEAAQLADACRTALHEVEITLDSPWYAYDCSQRETFQYAENEERVQYFYAGATYRVRAVKH